MPLTISKLAHVNITAPPELEDVTKNFYAITLGMTEVPKPPESKGRGGAWYQLGNVQLHLSREQTPSKNDTTKQHVCYLVEDLNVAEQHLRAAGVAIIPDSLPIPGSPRFYVRDPAGNLIEIAQA